MSKLNAIYASLDNGNPRSALRLCQQALSKSGGSSQIIRALMALAHSRLDQSEEALPLCEALESEGLNDSTVVETLGYVYRREGRFDLLSNLFSMAALRESDADLPRQAYIASVQSGRFESLGILAAKLVKLTGVKIYYAWAAFGMVLRDPEDKTKLTLALAMLDKVGTNPTSNDQAENRMETCARTHAFLSLFRIQILSKLAQWDEIREILKTQSGLISSDERNALLRDVDFLEAGSPVLCPGNDVELGNLTDVVVSLNTDMFIETLKLHISSSLGRSDCVVTTAPFLAIARPSDLDEFLFALLESADTHLKYVNACKLIYGVVDVHRSDPLAILNRAIACMQEEDDLDECSPGKQLLLLSAIVFLEQEKLVDALTLLDYGASRFRHCSHVRLVQCIVYTRLGLMSRGIERFESLGIKNAQWVGLEWLIRGPLENFFCAKKQQLANEKEMYLKRNRSEVMYSIASLMEHNTFYKFNELQVEEEKSCHFSDFSPLLFISMPEPGSVTTPQLAAWLSNKDLFSSRACGFTWPQELTRPFFDPIGVRPEISRKRVIGRLISDSDTTQPELKWTVVSLITDLLDNPTTDDLDLVEREIVDALESSMEDRSDWRSTLKFFGILLNRRLPALVGVCEGACADLPKKSAKRKSLKAIVSSVKSRLESLHEALSSVGIGEEEIDSTLPNTLMDARRTSVLKFRDDLELEKTDLKAALAEYQTRFKQIKF